MADLYPYLGPEDDLLRRGFEAATKHLAREAAAKGSEGSSGLFNEFEPQLDPVELNKGFIKVMAETKVAGGGGAEGGRRGESGCCGPYERWSKVALLAALVEAGEGGLAAQLRAFLEVQGLDVLMFPEVARAYCLQMRRALEPAHAALFPRGIAGAPAVAPVVEGALPDPSLVPRAAALDPAVAARLLELAHHIHLDPVLFTMAARILKATLLRESHPYLTSSLFMAQRKRIAPEELAPAREAYERAADLIARVLMPALAMTTGDQAMAMELWDLLSVIPYTIRWELYIRAKDIGVGPDAPPFLQAARRRTDKLARRMLKRSIMPETESDRRLVFTPRALQFAKISHALPGPAVVQMLDSVQAYGNQAEIFADMFRHLSPFSQDMACMAIVRRLVNREMCGQKLSADGINPALWLQNLARFLGLVCRAAASRTEVAAPDVTPRPFLQLVANVFKDLDYRAQEQDLLVMHEILSSMSGQGCLPPNEMGDRHVEAWAGGSLLRNEVLGGSSNDSRAAKAQARCLRVLLDALTEGPPSESLGVPLLILLSQRKQHVLSRADFTDSQLKVLGDRYDRCHQAFLQLSELLQRAATGSRDRGERPLNYARLLPSLSQLAQEFQLEPEEIFHMYRPVLGRIERPMVAVEEGELEGDRSPEERARHERATAEYEAALARLDEMHPGGAVFKLVRVCPLIVTSRAKYLVSLL